MFTRLWRYFTCKHRSIGRQCEKANIAVTLDSAEGCAYLDFQISTFGSGYAGLGRKYFGVVRSCDEDAALPDSTVMTGPVPPPLQPPIIVTPPLISGFRRPRVVVFYRIWCALFVVFYLAFAGERILIARGTVEPHFSPLDEFVLKNNPDLRGQWNTEKRADAPAFAAFTFAVALLYLAAALVPRKPWAWIYGIVILATTVFPFIVTVSGALPLLIYWLRPEVKRFFGRIA